MTRPFVTNSVHVGVTGRLAVIEDEVREMAAPSGTCGTLSTLRFFRLFLFAYDNSVVYLR